MQPHTHLAIDTSLCGRIERLIENEADVVLETTSAMAVDARGLIHGGFVFGAADYAAMLAVDHPNVVLGSADVRFMAPVRAGQAIRLRAIVASASGRKRRVEVEGSLADAGPRSEAIFIGTFVCLVLDHHVLEG